TMLFRSHIFLTASYPMPVSRAKAVFLGQAAIRSRKVRIGLGFYPGWTRGRSGQMVHLVLFSCQYLRSCTMWYYMYSMDTLSERLRKARQDAGYDTASAAAAAFSWNVWTYTAAESGKRRPSRDRLVHYSKAFDVSLDWLLQGGSSDSNAEPPR